jgi:N-methylhydantoinase A
MVQYGGAGALFSAPIARSLGISRVIVPGSASTFSAAGLMHADSRRSLVQTINWNVLREGPERARAAYLELAAAAREELRADGFEDEAIEVKLEGDLKFIGQAFEVTMEVDVEALDSRAVYDQFVSTYEAMYGEGTAWEGFDVMLLNCRVTGIGRTAKPETPRVPMNGGDPEAARKGSREVFMPDAGRAVEMAIYSEDRLGPGARIEGPAILELRDTTIYVPEAAALGVDEFANYVIEVS